MAPVPLKRGAITGSTALSCLLIHSLLQRLQTLFVTSPGFLFEVPRYWPVSKSNRLILGLAKYLPIQQAKMSSLLRGESFRLQNAHGVRVGISKRGKAPKSLSSH